MLRNFPWWIATSVNVGTDNGCLATPLTDYLVHETNKVQRKHARWTLLKMLKRAQPLAQTRQSAEAVRDAIAARGRAQAARLAADNAARAAAGKPSVVAPVAAATPAAAETETEADKVEVEIAGSHKKNHKKSHKKSHKKRKSKKSSKKSCKESCGKKKCCRRGKRGCRGHDGKNGGGTLFLASDNSLPNGHFLGLGVTNSQFARSTVVMPADATLTQLVLSIRDFSKPVGAVLSAEIIAAAAAAPATPISTGIIATIPAGAATFALSPVGNFTVAAGDLVSVRFSNSANSALPRGATATIYFTPDS